MSHNIERSMAERKFVGRLVENADHVSAKGHAQEDRFCNGMYWQE